MILCPKCQSELKKENNTMRCENGHCYDIAKEGYVNLILANRKHSADPGDNNESLICRQDFLAKGYYQNLADDLVSVIETNFKDGSIILDAGCGTGYYLNHIMTHLKRRINFLATDIAKKGVAMTSKKCRDAFCFVGNVFHLPFPDESLDGLMSVFTPYSSEEFKRVVKKGGIVIAVNPGKEHLYQLKEIVYDSPYYNEEHGYDLDGFELIDQHNVRYSIHLNSREDINHLWKMMPYYHTTKLSDSEKLLNMNETESTVDFLVSIYRKENG